MWYEVEEMMAVTQKWLEGVGGVHEVSPRQLTISALSLGCRHVNHFMGSDHEEGMNDLRPGFTNSVQ